MRNPVTKLSAAVVIVAVAGIAGVVMWTGTGSGIALADVLAQVQQVTAYVCQMTMTISGKGPGGLDMNENVEGTLLVSQDDGMKMVMDSVDPNSGVTSRHEMYVPLKEKAAISLMHDMKMYARMEFDDTLIENIRRENYDPSSMLEEILDGGYKSLGRSTIDGVEVEGFETTDPNYQGGREGQVDGKIWVDVKTKLPVRLEMDMETDGSQMHAVMHSFQWNYPVDADTFKPVIPADYMIMPRGNPGMPAVEEGAIAGLKLCADLTGHYPEKMDSTTFTAVVAKLEDKDDPAFDLSIEKVEWPSQEEMEKLPPEELLRKMEEQNKKAEEQFRKWKERAEKSRERFEKRQEQFKETMDRLMPVHGAVMFYMALTEEGKDPAYYGNVVTPQDTDKVLMRWKVSDDQYRVIFGGLHAETVDAQTLAELEKDLPK